MVHQQTTDQFALETTAFPSPAWRRIDPRTLSDTVHYCSGLRGILYVGDWQALEKEGTHGGLHKII